VGVKLPTGREIDGKYLDENVKEFQKEIGKWKIEWNEFGATLMCDSWTGPTQKSIINFLVQDHKFIMQVRMLYILVVASPFFTGHSYIC
jgi:hypothetical protein